MQTNVPFALNHPILVRTANEFNSQTYRKPMNIQFDNLGLVYWYLHT